MNGFKKWYLELLHSKMLAAETEDTRKIARSALEAAIELTFVVNE